MDEDLNQTLGTGIKTSFNEQDVKDTVARNTLASGVALNSAISDSDKLQGIDAINTADQAVQQQKKAIQTAKKLKDAMDANDNSFSPLNYITPEAKSTVPDEKLTTSDYFPTHGQPLMIGSYSGKYIGNVPIFAAQGIIPMGVIDARRKKFEATIAAQQRKAEADRQAILSIRYKSAPQFNEEINQQNLVRIKDYWLKKHGNNYSSLINDPDFILEQNKIRDLSNKTLYYHDKMSALAERAKDKDAMLTDEQRKNIQDWNTATGNFDAKTTIENSLNGKLNIDHQIGNAEAYDNMRLFLDKDNLEKFVVKAPVDLTTGKTLYEGGKLSRINQYKGVGFSKSQSTTLDKTYLDEKATRQGIKSYVLSKNIYGAGNPNADENSPEYKKYKEFEDKTWEEAKAYKNSLDAKQTIFDNGAAAYNSHQLAKAKAEKDSTTYYKSVLSTLTNPDKLNDILAIKDPSERKQKYKEYSKQFKRGVDSDGRDIYGYTTFDLGAPASKQGFYQSYNTGIPIQYKTIINGKQVYGRRFMTAHQVADFERNNPNLKRKGDFVGGYYMPAEMVNEAEVIRRNRSGEMLKTSEFGFHAIRDKQSGKLVPLEYAKDADGDLSTQIGSSGNIITGYTEQPDPNNPKQMIQVPVQGKYQWTTMNGIDKEIERASLESKVTASEQTKEY